MQQKVIQEEVMTWSDVVYVDRAGGDRKTRLKADRQTNTENPEMAQGGIKLV